MYKLHKLKNGMRLALVPLKQTKAVTVLVMVRVGSRFETKEINGISHFIEHMLFKGTKKRPDPVTISHELDSIGADFNAFTGKEFTGYYVKSATEHIEKSVDILSDILKNPLFKKSEFERERNVIIDEINMYEDNPRAVVDKEFDALLYNGNSLARSVIGPKSVIASVPLSTVKKYYTKHYCAENIVIAIAGSFNAHTVKDLVIKKFRGIPTHSAPEGPEFFKTTQTTPQVKIINKKNEQAHIVLGFPSYQDGHPLSAAIGILSIILGSGASSRLFVEVREKLGLCYSVQASVDTRVDGGDFIVKAGLNPNSLEKTIKVIVKELRTLKNIKVTSQELKKAKNYINGKTILSLEDSEVHADWYTKELLYREKPRTIEKRLLALKNVTAKEVQEVAQDIFKTAKANLIVLGPYPQTLAKKLEGLLKL